MSSSAFGCDNCKLVISQLLASVQLVQVIGKGSYRRLAENRPKAVETLTQTYVGGNGLLSFLFFHFEKRPKWYNTAGSAIKLMKKPIVVLRTVPTNTEVFFYGL